MFVSVVLDPSNVENARAEAAVLTRFGFNKVQRACWETMSLSENQLNLLKRELDSVTDYNIKSEKMEKSSFWFRPACKIIILPR